MSGTIARPFSLPAGRRAGFAIARRGARISGASYTITHTHMESSYSNLWLNEEDRYILVREQEVIQHDNFVKEPDRPIECAALEAVESTYSAVKAGLSVG